MCSKTPFDAATIIAVKVYAIFVTLSSFKKDICLTLLKIK